MTGEVLTWARNEAGISPAQLAKSMDQSEATILAWEGGSKHPTLRQLEKAAELLRRPLAIFFFPVPPAIPSPKREFRMLPDPSNENEARDTSLAISEAQLRQMSILELASGDNPAGSKYLFATKGSLDPVVVRQKLGATMQEQKDWPSASRAFAAWRGLVQSAGIFVFKRSFKQKNISGFCLPHDVAPVIIVNNSTAWSRQIFTLFHELGHLIHHHHGVTRADYGYASQLERTDKEIEAACNRFAADFLIPPPDFVPYARQFDGTMATVSSIAETFRVSREVVLRRLLDLRKVSKQTYEEWAMLWAQNYYARPVKINAPEKGKSDGNYYNTKASYLGGPFLRLAFNSYYQGEIDVVELADHLGVKARTVGKFVKFYDSQVED